LPTIAEVTKEYLRSINFLSDRRRTLHAIFEAGYWGTAVATAVFVTKYVTPIHVLVYLVTFYILANVYNTVWYHRYCSHYSFRFSHVIFPRILLWLNPFGYREEVYALNHYVHHNASDQDHDPYGPHLGWLGTYLASDCNLDTQLTVEEYEGLKRSLVHIGFPFASFESFRRWGSVEWIPHYLARWAFATVFWGFLWYGLGGWPLVFTWYAVQFNFHASARDFNYRGHGGSSTEPPHVDGWDFDRSTRGLNQSFYGLLAGEWHNNHHAFRTSANCGFLSGQIDVPFAIIRLLHKLKIVTRYNDHRELFSKRYGIALAASATHAATRNNPG